MLARTSSPSNWEQGVRSTNDENYVLTRFRVRGETVYSMWELVDDTPAEAEEEPFQPVDYPVAFVN